MELKPGYRQTEVGVIPEDWEDRTLQSCARSIVRGASPRPIEDPKWFDNASPVGWLRISDITSSKRYLRETVQRLSHDGIRHSRRVPKGGLVMSICATVGRPIETRIDVCIHDGFVLFDQPKVEQDFLYYVLADLESRWASKGQTGSQMNLNTGLIKGTRIAVPPSSTEQSAIATALGDVDALLAAQDALIAKKRAIKQGAMQELLTGKRRLPGFSGEWGMKSVGELSRIRNQKIATHLVDAGTLCVELENVGQGTGCLESRSTAGNAVSTKYTFQAGDVLFGRLRSYLRKYWLATEPGLCTTEIWPLAVDAETLVPGFLFAVVQTDAFIEAASIAFGTHMPRADWGVIRNFEIRLPNVEEQSAIVEVLSDMDAGITALEAQRAKTAQLKQGMMQALLTGRIRLV